MTIRIDFTGQLAEDITRAAIEAADPGRLLAEFMQVDENGLILGDLRFEASAVYVVSVGCR
jgi:hypothetical protein